MSGSGIGQRSEKKERGLILSFHSPAVSRDLRITPEVGAKAMLLLLQTESPAYGPRAKSSSNSVSYDGKRFYINLIG